MAQEIFMSLRSAGSIVLLLACGALHAQYPAKPVTLVVPFPAGSDADLSARNLAQHAQKYIGTQPVVVVNRPGASGSIGTMAVRDAPPDGYTLLLARIASHAIQPAIDTKTPYRWNDFSMISTLEVNPYVCAVRADAPYKSLPELLEEIKRKPGTLNFSTAGAGTLQNFGPQYLFALAGLPKDAAIGIHYKGSGDLVSSLLGGQVQFACNNLGTLLPQIQAGKLRGIMTSTIEPLASIPQVPPARDLGWPEMEKLAAWSALMGPRGLGRDVLGRWGEVLARLAQDKEWLAGNEKLGAMPALRTPAETEKFVGEQYRFFEALATRLGIRQ
jgi:tripartite-type tricarboxylate transporter receptor subunit TctC